MTTTETKPPTDVIAALARVMSDMPGINKGERAAQGYAYRGIEQITAQVQPLLAKHGVVFVPHVLDAETREVIVNGKPWTDERLRVSYTVYGPGGRDDMIEVGPFLGIGRDNSDKGANKAMSQAYKYALLQTLCIGDAKDDADGVAHEADKRPSRQDRGTGGGTSNGRGAPAPDARVSPSSTRAAPPPPNVDPSTGELLPDPAPNLRRSFPAPTPAAPEPTTTIEKSRQVKKNDPIGAAAFEVLKARKQALTEAQATQFQGDLEGVGLMGFSKESNAADAAQVAALLDAAEAEVAS